MSVMQYITRDVGVFYIVRGCFFHSFHSFFYAFLLDMWHGV